MENFPPVPLCDGLINATKITSSQTLESAITIDARTTVIGIRNLAATAALEVVLNASGDKGAPIAAGKVGWIVTDASGVCPSCYLKLPAGESAIVQEWS